MSAPSIDDLDPILDDWEPTCFWIIDEWQPCDCTHRTWPRHVQVRGFIVDSGRTPERFGWVIPLETMPQDDDWRGPRWAVDCNATGVPNLRYALFGI